MSVRIIFDNADSTVTVLQDPELRPGEDYLGYTVSTLDGIDCHITDREAAELATALLTNISNGFDVVAQWDSGDSEYAQ